MLFKKSEAVASTVYNAKGGHGQLNGQTYVSPDNRPSATHLAMGAINTLTPGASLGFHVHETNEEIYVILEGNGIFTDNDHSLIPVGPGDISLTRQGEGHALENTGSEPLTFLAVIIDDGN